jgi:hypothetical protein
MAQITVSVGWISKQDKTWLVVGALAGWLLLHGLMVPAQAAETVVLRYSIFRRSLPVADLTEFAETGEPSRRLQRYLRMANEEPERFRQFITEETPADPQTLDRVLVSPAGDVLLDKLSEYIYTPEQDDREALRVALNQAAENDSKISFLEVLQTYPAAEAHINVRRAINTYRQIAELQQQVEGVLGGGLDEVLREINPF